MATSDESRAAALRLLRQKMAGWAPTIARAARADVAISAITGDEFTVDVSWPAAGKAAAGKFSRGYTGADAISSTPSCVLTRQLIALVLDARGV